MNENTSFTKMVLLKGLNARTDHDVQLNKLRHIKSMASNLIPNGDTVQMQFCCKKENFAKSAQICGSQRVPLILTKKTSTHTLFSDHKQRNYWELKVAKSCLIPAIAVERLLT